MVLSFHFYDTMNFDTEVFVFVIVFVGVELGQEQFRVELVITRRTRAEGLFLYMMFSGWWKNIAQEY